MKQNALRDSLTRLHAELAEIKHVDPASGAALKKLAEDIRRILENSGEIPENHHQSLLKSLEESVGHFEASHPLLVSMMNRIIKNLSDMGV
jgi:hypothetical protein